MSKAKENYGNVIYIVKLLGRKATCVAAPEEVLVGIDDQLTFKNLTDNEVRIVFGSASPFNQPDLLLPPEQTAVLLVGNVDLAAYPFDLFCAGQDAYPNKVARPRIIVYKS